MQNLVQADDELDLLVGGRLLLLLGGRRLLLGGGLRLRRRLWRGLGGRRLRARSRRGLLRLRARQRRAIRSRAGAGCAERPAARQRRRGQDTEMHCGKPFLNLASATA